jgi:outer membrane protein
MGWNSRFVSLLTILLLATPARAQTQATSAGAPLPRALPAMETPAAQTAAQGLPAAPEVLSLSLADAEKIAVQNHPLIQIAEHRAAFAKAKVQEAQSAYYPQVNGALTGTIAETDSRIAAGYLTNPIVFDRFATGATVNQLVTDFGRTQALVKSYGEHARAQQANVVTSRADVLLQVHQAFFVSLKSKAVLTVAQETVKDRQLIADQITLMQENKLKSGLDVAFVKVDLAQAQLLLIQAQNDVQASYAQLSAALGYREQHVFQLSENQLPPPPPQDFVQVLQEAFQSRPELAGQRFEVNAAHNYAVAERDLWFPTLGAAGAAGVTPSHEDAFNGSRYAAAGFNLSIPIFNGHLFGSLRTQANEQYREQQQYLRDLEDRIARDVRTAWLNANSAFERLAVTEQLLNEAKLAEDLAASRYRMGLSSIIELSQAQLNLTQAELQQASAKYDFQARLSELQYQQGLLR